MKAHNWIRRTISKEEDLEDQGPGATVRALQDGRLEVAPKRALNDELRAAIRSHKRELLTELAQCGDSAEPAALESGVPAAFLVDSPRYREVWVATDAEVAAAIRVEEQRRDQPRPVVMLDDMAHLESKSEKAIQSALNVFTVFPGAKVLQ